MGLPAHNKEEIVFAALAGVLYTLFGMAHIAEGFGINTGLAQYLFVPGDILGGACLLVIGMVFLKGAREMTGGINAGVSFVYVGILLSLVFMAVYILTMGGYLLDSVLVPEDYEEWSIMDSFRPGIYLGILSVIGVLHWKDRFSLNEILVFREAT